MSLKSDASDTCFRLWIFGAYCYAVLLKQHQAHKRCTVPSCLFLLLLLIYGKAVLEPVMLGAIKH